MPDMGGEGHETTPKPDSSAPRDLSIVLAILVTLGGLAAVGGHADKEAQEPQFKTPLSDAQTKAKNLIEALKGFHSLSPEDQKIILDQIQSNPEKVKVAMAHIQDLLKEQAASDNKFQTMVSATNNAPALPVVRTP